jgi:hypothetical protein
MQSDDKKQVPKILKEKQKNHILKKHLEGKETEDGRSGIRLAIDRTFYGFTPNEKNGMSSMSLALDVITDDGNSIGLQYHLISSFIDFDISGVISFEANGFKVKIEGKNLRPVYEYLLEHRLVWIEGKTSEWEDFPEDETVISSVTVTPLG